MSIFPKFNKDWAKIVDFLLRHSDFRITFLIKLRLYRDSIEKLELSTALKNSLTFLVHVFYVVAQSHFVVKDVQIDGMFGVASVLSWKRSGYLKNNENHVL